jgi:hypothetical protein
MEKGEQAAKLLGERPQRPPKEWPMRLSVPGDSRTLLWHGFKCGSAVVNPVALGDGPAVWRTCIVATAAWEGELPLKARSILRPGDTFNRVLGKRLALARLVKLLIPGKGAAAGKKKEKVGAAERKKRGKLFLALAPTPRAPKYNFITKNGTPVGTVRNFVTFDDLANWPQKESGLKPPTAPRGTLDSLSMADWDKASAAYYNRYREQQQKEGRK